MPQIEVSFDIDANGIMKVSAKDKATNKDQSIVIQPSGGLNKSEIDNMIKKAEEMKEDDKQRREAIEVKNHLDQNINNVNKSLSEHKDKLNESDVSSIETAVKEANEAMESGDVDRMNQAKTNLE